NNIVHNVAEVEWSQHSGISILESFNMGFGNDSNGYSNYITGNVVYQVENKVRDRNGRFTDGNCIIMDRTKINNYSGRTLIANNLCLDNGGRGIQIFESKHVDVVNNTVYHNLKTAEIASSGGELGAFYSSDVEFANNVVFARNGLKPARTFDSSNIRFAKNLYVADTSPEYNGASNDDSRVGPGTAVVNSPSTNPNPANFKLSSGSPAINAGTNKFNSVMKTDFVGAARVAGGVIDLGAFESSSSAPATTAAPTTAPPTTASPTTVAPSPSTTAGATTAAPATTSTSRPQAPTTPGSGDPSTTAIPEISEGTVTTVSTVVPRPPTTVAAVDPSSTDQPVEPAGSTSGQAGTSVPAADSAELADQAPSSTSTAAVTPAPTTSVVDAAVTPTSGILESEVIEVESGVSPAAASAPTTENTARFEPAELPTVSRVPSLPAAPSPVALQDDVVAQPAAGGSSFSSGGPSPADGAQAETEEPAPEALAFAGQPVSQPAVPIEIPLAGVIALCLLASYYRPTWLDRRLG
ncbi:MAG: hypothetical protein HKN24_01830, partial [Acidimicrobiales bacterium]|nr:hypothetical protein [Acidimicrobiales bacterium]